MPQRVALGIDRLHWDSVLAACTARMQSVAVRQVSCHSEEACRQDGACWRSVLGAGHGC